MIGFGDRLTEKNEKSILPEIPKEQALISSMINEGQLESVEPKGWNELQSYPDSGYGILIYNNDHSTIEEVIINIMKTSKMTMNEALFVAQYVHEHGCAFISVVDKKNVADEIVGNLQKSGIHANHFTE